MEKLHEDLVKLNELLKTDQYEARELFKSVYALHIYEIDGNRKVPTFPCGSVKFDTVKAVYRLLFLTQPKLVDFSDMYKSESLFALVSPDHQFVADFQFYKYALIASYGAGREHVSGQKKLVQCGVPGSDTGIKAESPLLKLWCATLKKCLHTKWMVYSGNDFEV